MAEPQHSTFAQSQEQPPGPRQGAPSRALRREAAPAHTVKSRHSGLISYIWWQHSIQDNIIATCTGYC